MIALQDDGRCPGAFYVGCHKETTVSTFTPPPSTTVFGSGCPTNEIGWIYAGKSCYLMSTTVMNWYSAQEVFPKINRFIENKNILVLLE